MSHVTAKSQPVRVGPGALVVMVGGVASGKSTVAKKLAEQMADRSAVVESDQLREQLFGDAARQGNPADIHGLGHQMTRIRLSEGLPVIYDATNLLARDRAGLVELARKAGAPLVAVWVDTPAEVMVERNAARNRVVPDHAMARMTQRAGQVRRRTLEAEGFQVVHINGETLELPELEFIPSGWDRRELTGPFDVIGDIHGCLHTFQTLMAKLGYREDGTHPDGRTLASVGDIVDRGAHTWDTWGYVAELVETGRLLLVKGNHEKKHGRYLERLVEVARRGGEAEEVEAKLRETQGTAHGLTAAIGEAISRGNVEEWERRAAQMRRLPSHMVLDEGRLVVCHGAARSDLIGRDSADDKEAEKEAESWFLYGAPTGERNQRGYPVRADWQNSWDGEAFVVVGHSTVADPRHVTAGGGSVNIDTGCAFGRNGVDVHTEQPFTGKLTAISWPEAQEDVTKAVTSVEVDPRDLA